MVSNIITNLMPFKSIENIDLIFFLRSPNILSSKRKNKYQILGWH